MYQNRLRDLREDQDKSQKEIANLTPGTTAYREAVEENNRLVEELVKNYPEFADFVEEK